MPSWQRVDIEELNKPRSTTIRGVDVTVYFGLDDMPRRIAGAYDEQQKKFVIQFEYDTEDEATKVVKMDEHVQFRIGKKSERLHQVLVDVDSMEVDFVRLQTKVQHLLKQLPSKAPKLGMDRIDNYVAASGAFEQVGERLLKTLQMN